MENQKIESVTFSGHSYYQAGVGMIHTPSWTRYFTMPISEVIDGYTVKTRLSGSDKNNMVKFILEFGGFPLPKDKYRLSEFDELVREYTESLNEKLTENEEPSQEHKDLVVKFWKRDLEEYGKEYTLYYIFSNRNFNRLNRRWIAQAMLSKGTVTFKELVNNYIHF